ncbi:hypothetical protein [Nostoc sp. C052]|nr:hypothetical protein [Nostoc sp. C052]
MSIRTARGSASTLPLKVNTPGLNSKWRWRNRLLEAIASQM